jgi:hypothetical protein
VASVRHRLGLAGLEIQAHSKDWKRTWGEDQSGGGPDVPRALGLCYTKSALKDNLVEGSY